MDKSIESIWKEGFLKPDALVAPRVNELYNRKSKDIVERMGRLSRFNVAMLIVFAVGFMIYTFLTGVPILLGIFISLLFVLPAIRCAKHFSMLSSIDKNVDSLTYLTSFQANLNGQQAENEVLARFFYPTAVVASSLIVWFGDGNQTMSESLLRKYPELPMLFGIPTYFLVGVIVAVLLTAIYGPHIYRFDSGLLYGQAVKKLDEIITDLEELKE